MLETLIAMLIVLVAAVGVGYGIYRVASGKSGCAGCRGCGAEDTACAPRRPSAAANGSKRPGKP